MKTRAGNGSAGFTSWQLNGAWGTFVGINMNSYLADGANYRIQKFMLLSDCSGSVEERQCPASATDRFSSVIVEVSINALPTDCSMSSVQTISTSITLASVPVPVPGTTAPIRSGSNTITNNPCNVLEHCLQGGSCSVVSNNESMRVNVAEQKTTFLPSQMSNDRWEENLMISFFIDDAGQSV